MDDRQCLIRCLTSPTLIRFYSIMNLVVWGTVLVLGQGVLPVLHGCAGVMIALEGIFAAASKNEDSIRLFMVLMLLNLVFCSIMGPLSALNIYQECYACAPNETIDGYGQLVLDNTSSEVLCAVSPFCERAFGLYGWILIIFGTILQLPIFLFTVGFYFSISRSPAKKQEDLAKSLEADTQPRVSEASREGDFVEVLPPASAVLFKPKEVLPPSVVQQFSGRRGLAKDSWNTDTDAHFFNSDLSSL